jgi:stage II sporulation protein D
VKVKALSIALLSALVATGLAGAGAPSAIGAIKTSDSFTVPKSRVFTLSGHGWGHGHGMSQWGAAGAASKGLSYSKILAFYYPGTASTNIGNPTVKVGLLSQYDRNPRNIHIADPGTLRIYNEATKKATLFKSTATWRVVRSAGKFEVQVASKGTWVTKKTASGPIHVDTSASTNHVTYPINRTYTGYFRLVPTSDSHFMTIANVSMQNYLGGVVPAESISSWPAAALQAQAVAARTYAAYHFAHPRSGSIQVYDTTSDQVFDGQGVRVASTNAAVIKTTGIIRTYKKAPILAQFSSSNGGWSTDGGEPYLSAHADPYDGAVKNSVHSWTASLPASTLEKRYPSIGTLKTLKITERDGNGAWGGRVLDVTLVGSKGNKTVSGGDIYSAYSWPSHAKGLRSTWFQVTTPAPKS